MGCTPCLRGSILTLFVFWTRGAALWCDFETDLCDWIQDINDQSDWLRSQGPTKLRERKDGDLGILFDHTLQSVEGWFIHANMTSLEVGDRVRIQTQTLPSSDDGAKLTFWYHMYFNGTSTNRSAALNVLLRGQDNTEMLIWRRDTSSSDDSWILGQVELPPIGADNQIVFEAIKGSLQDIEIGIDDVKVSNTIIAVSQNVTYSECNFETGFCDFLQDEHDDFNWTLHKGSTPSGATGPEHDHTHGESGEGFYAYVEASAPQVEGNKARLLSPVFEVQEGNEDQCTVTFYNHMHGTAMGQLNVYIRDVTNSSEELVWSKAGRHQRTYGDHWLPVELEFNVTYSFQVIFEGVVGASFLSDMAIDDVRISRRVSPTLEMTSLPLITTKSSDVNTTDDIHQSRLSSASSFGAAMTSPILMTSESDDVSTKDDIHQSDVFTSRIEELTTNQQPSTEAVTSKFMETTVKGVSSTADFHQSGFHSVVTSEKKSTEERLSTEPLTSTSKTTTKNNSIVEGTTPRNGSTTNQPIYTNSHRSSMTKTTKEKNITTDDTRESSSPQSPSDTLPSVKVTSRPTESQRPTRVKPETTTVLRQQTTGKVNNTQVFDGLSETDDRTRLIVTICLVVGGLLVFFVIVVVTVVTVNHCIRHTSQWTVKSNLETNQQGVENAVFSDKQMKEGELFPKTDNVKYSNEKLQLERIDDKAIVIDTS
ncbi:MAM and LDL-receptor class A domain-containing protein 1-like isoform X2 [Ptychodera flava]|uniref:MAM and LDL-receptor class A domain-containing protein 1-like isoform X2 n=1 Tax=Ptychodera flava TaxID=63121 RepID=UPI00396A05D3